MNPILRNISPWVRLVRPVNLLMAALTQLLFWYCVITPFYGFYDIEPALGQWQVALLVLATVLIAAGGYVINDYYDLPIDLVNKPEKVVVSREVSDQGAFNYYIALTASGLAAALAVALAEGRFTLVFFPAVVAAMLWFYAQSFKRMFLVGNIVVSLATAGVIFLLLLYEVDWEASSVRLEPHTNEILKFGLGYMAFAFVVSMLREVVKDLQDREGDEQFECRTLPVVLGPAGGKAVALVLALVLAAGLVPVQTAMAGYGNFLPVAYLGVFVQLPALAAALLTVRAAGPADYGRASALIKAVMLAGVLTMVYIGFLN